MLGHSVIVKGDADAAMAGADVVVKRPLRRRRIAGRADRAARDRRAVAGRPRHGLVVDAGPVRGPQRNRARAPDPGVEGSRDRAAARWRLRLEVRLPLRGARRRARARSRAPGQARLLAGGGVRRPRPPARGDGDRARDGRPSRRDARRAPRAARARRRRLLRRGRLLRADRRDARLRPVRDRERPRRVDPRLHEQPALRARSALRRRRRRAGRSSSTWTSWPGRSTSIRSSSAAAR